MAAALGFLIDAALTGASIAAAIAKPATPAITNVQIITGSGKGSQAGGNVPHIAVWNKDGVRSGQYHPNKKDKIEEGVDRTIEVRHDQNGNGPDDPYYVMLSNLGNDAICIAAVAVTNSKIAATFVGDTGHRCGQSWFLSENKMFGDFQKPKCVWLDADHSNGINARALSFHVNDMSFTNERFEQFQNNTDYLCKSTPRFSFWGNLLPDGIIPFFEPKLEYLVSESGGEGADKDPERVLDKPGQYDKSVYIQQGETSKRSAQRPRHRSLKARSSNHNPEHLIITDQAEDNVREVCESETSYGWDIASTV